MSQLVLGTVQFGLDYGVNNSNGRPTFEQVTKILNTAKQNGILVLDTADAYGDSQSVLKKYFSEQPSRFQVMSKFIWENDRDFNYHIERSLSQLGLVELSSYYFHRFDDFVSFKFFNQIQQAKKNGLMKMLGVSIYSIDELEFVLNHVEVDLIQLPFNLLDNNHRKQELLSKAHQNGKKIYVRSAFLQGLFFKDPMSLPIKLQELSKVLQKVRDVCQEYELTIEQLCLGYLKSKGFIDGILIGVDSEAQLISNIKSFSTTISKEVIDKIETIEVLNLELLNPANWNK